MPLDLNPSAHRSHGMIGTVERLLKGEPSTTFVLYARYISVRRVRSTMRTTRVCLKRNDVLSLNTSASFGSFARSTVIEPICRHAIAKRERSSATPTLPFTPPVRAWERYRHTTPGASGSSKALTQILSFAPRIETLSRHSQCPPHRDAQ